MSQEVISKLSSDYDELFRRAGVLLVGLTVQQCSWQANRKRWSIAQCFSHLTQTADLYLPKMQEGLAARRAAGSSARPARGMLHKLQTKLVLSLEHPGTVSWPAPRQLRPQGEDLQLRAKDILAAFVGSYTEIRNFLEYVDADEELSVVRVDNPIIPCSRWTLGQCILLHLLHARRHFTQAERIKAAPGFPSATP